MNALAEERNKWLERYNVALVSVFSVGLVIQHTRSSFLRFWVSYIFLLSVVYGPLTIIIHSAWCLRLRANGCNNSQQCWDLQCIVGRIQPISLCKPCVMCVPGPNNVGSRLCKRIQHCCATIRRSRNKRNVGSFWLKSLTGFKLCATNSNGVCKRTQHVTSNNVGSCWSTILRPFARSLRNDLPQIDRSLERCFVKHLPV